MEKAKENHKKEILIIGGVVFFLIILVIGIIIFTKDEKTNQPKTKEMLKLEEGFKKINEINKHILSENLATEISFEAPKGNPCYKYINEDKTDVINAINNLYEMCLGENEGFVIQYPDGDESKDLELYVCLPESCSISEDINYEITSKDEKEIIFDVNNKDIKKSYKYKETDNNTWKFDKPIISCK